MAIWTELEQPVTVCVILFHTDNDTITLVVAILSQPVLMLECTGTPWTELATWVPFWEYLGLWDPWPVLSSAVQEEAGLLMFVICFKATYTVGKRQWKNWPLNCGF